LEAISHFFAPEKQIGSICKSSRSFDASDKLDLVSL